MIRVDRQKIRTPAILFGDDSPAAIELKKVISFIEEQRKQQAAAGDGGKKRKVKSFPFDVYSRNEIKDALAQLFHGKCAYCETRYAATQPVDVEHFRPKAGIDEDPDHLGYYWLAASWNNLFPSCIDCNRERLQIIPGDPDDPDAPGRRFKLGKGNRFPLAAGSARAKAPDDPALEIPLLLDPCNDRPEDYLEFTDDGIVRPKASSAASIEKARVSIEVYGLNRTGLVFSRLEVLRLLQARIYTISCLVDVLNHELDDDLLPLIEDLLSHELAELERFRDATRPYAQMCTQVIGRFAVSVTGAAAGLGDGTDGGTESASDVDR